MILAQKDKTENILYQEALPMQLHNSYVLDHQLDRKFRGPSLSAGTGRLKGGGGSVTED